VFLETSVEKLMEQETRGQEIPQQLMCRHNWRPFLNMSLTSSCVIDEAFFLVKSKIYCLGTAVLRCQIIGIF
jgi:hypothetical protein